MIRKSRIGIEKTQIVKYALKAHINAGVNNCGFMCLIIINLGRGNKKIIDAIKFHI